MTTKDRLKRKIDMMPNDLIDKVNDFINKLTEKEAKAKNNKTLKLNGIFDDLNIRENAYEKDTH